MQKIFGNKNCPNCGIGVGWKKLLFGHGFNSKGYWHCPNCNETLVLNPKRTKYLVFVMSLITAVGFFLIIRGLPINSLLTVLIMTTFNCSVAVLFTSIESKSVSNKEN